ncbi:putative ATP-binding cassette protein subfamily D member 2 [Leptomonas pyrrhocoris]|uniref:Putative ATP-binding cassette protein subfamily D member 2 n=1 Tax=Leptomonas pyrrhocoris TaxID=157538 RepID=A0A0M9FQQ7_LEPPY|nr:putative ATP-binding cassette protein subfamily D member 2 [Leptomonas pyrrhocoris]XP_015652365.1 putative ATP-binding cassette protein subfamily D member 2 [Leptomonas pyrrhocoris]KPA73925.1 putative ATP-binding cassette protein subfamily D member 2 [Leptomonas pyrrhocoris]KPA73926.1 putative ATP-binding cassette protein subfamily D member 2 [Leptomonas pyrrhocoris]|eukprot:XP_015652364.1 putative ATP-binding cassette protein subfamily D member 2 [Leptomonas pyrrhocoris]
MATTEALCEYVREYAASRLRDPVMVSWVGGSVALLTTMYATSSGRRMVQAAPPPRVRNIVKTMVEEAKAAPPSPSKGTAPAPAVSAPSSPAYPALRAAALSEAINAATAAVVRHARDPEEVSMLRHFLHLLRIAIPTAHGREARSLALLFALMITRAFVSVRIVDASGIVSRTAIEGNLGRMFKALITFGLSCVPAALLNVTLDYYSELLDLHFRENVTTYLTERYLKRRVFFQLAGLHAVDHVDQRITEDARNWSRVAAALFTSIPRPFIEAVMFTYTLYKQTGVVGPTATWGYYLGFAAWVWFFAPNMDWLVGQRMEKQGAFQAAHQDVLTHAEEITMTRGFPFYEKLLQRLFKAVTDQSRYAAYVYARFNFTEIMYNKYGSVLMGYTICAVAAIRQKAIASTAEDAASTLTKAAYTFKTLATAVGRLLWNIKLIMVVGGYTRRLTQFIIALDRAEKLAELQTDRTAQSPATRGPTKFQPTKEGGAPEASFEDLFGRVVRDEHIEFVDVPLILPTGECLCQSMSFYVKPGMNLLIIGPNGCGKSSTFRLLGELWPLRGGRIIKPEAGQLYYVPQRPYMFDGTLLEQVIYPLKRKDLTVGESELYGYLQMAGLDYIFTKSSMSWETRLSWSDDSLSLGEQQRLAMARLFFHRPRFAILDECSSLIDLDVERQIYNRCVQLGITVITIAHRRSVWQYHNWILYFDGNGGYMFSPLQFTDGASALVLTCVKSATDASQVGKEVRIPVTDRLCTPGDASEVPQNGDRPPAAVAAHPQLRSVSPRTVELALPPTRGARDEPATRTEKEESKEDESSTSAEAPASPSDETASPTGPALQRGRRNRHRKGGSVKVKITAPGENGSTE